MPGVHVREDGSELVAEPISDHDVQRVITTLRSADRKIRLSLRRLEQLGRFDEESQLVQVGAGVKLNAVEEAANKVGLSLGPLSPGAMALSVGEFLEGPYAGLRAIPGGRLEPLSASLRVVTPDALVTESRAAPKSATGPELDALHLGGRRRFGVIVGARLKLQPRPGAHQRAVFSFPTAGALTAALISSMQDGVVIASAAMDRRAERFVCTIQLLGNAESIERDLATVGRRALKEHGRPASPTQASEGRGAPIESLATWDELRSGLEQGSAVVAFRLCVGGAIVKASKVGTALGGAVSSPLLDAIAASVDPDGVMKGLL
ncbi:MAG: FAD-binding oxidoreductase [Myxococcaceae bacterium]